MKRRHNILLGVASIPLLACSAILGIDALPSSTDVADASTAEGSSPGADSSATDGSNNDGAAQDGQTGCHDGDKRCAGSVPQTCASGTWSSGSSCPAVCSAGACINPPSCSALASNCGPGGADSCCKASHVPAGTFSRSYDQTTYTDPKYKASVSDFVLDDYEVTVARFRTFAQAYTKPADGSGKDPNNPGDNGWNKSSFESSLPNAQSDLETSLSTTNCPGSTYTTSAGTNENKPVTCMTWYVAFAFCIWDGGRLPTEAEWNYAAAGGGDSGSGQRVYPWSSPPTDTTVNATYATYNVSVSTAVGSHSSGAARWGQLDLAGNAAEWVLDAYASPYASTSCADCANFTGSARGLRGGSYLSGNSTLLLTSYRNNSPPSIQSNDIGMRCARTN